MAGFDPLVLHRDAAAHGLSVDEVARLLRATADIVAAELYALGDLATWRPAEGEWCANEVVGHLVEADRRGFIGRIRRILAAPPGVEPLEEGWDQPSVATARRDGEKPGTVLIDEMTASRGEAVALVRSLTPADLDRAARHRTVGRVTVRELLGEWCFHDRSHLQQLFKNVQARAWPVMGNTRRFTRPDDADA